MNQVIIEMRKRGENEPQAIVKNKNHYRKKFLKIKAFPPIATNPNGGIPRDVAAKAAFDAVLNWFAANQSLADQIDEVRLVPFDRPDERLYKTLWQTVKFKKKFFDIFILSSSSGTVAESDRDQVQWRQTNDHGRQSADEQQHLNSWILSRHLTPTPNNIWPMAN